MDGTASLKSSAIRPGPTWVAASPCTQAAAAAASKPGMPWARSPAIKPASTSPAPAVVSHGGALSLTPARPLGAARTVSGPLSNTTVPGRAAAARAMSILEVFPTISASFLNRRANSPACGVRTAGWSRPDSIAHNALASSSKLVSASASSTTARGPLSLAATNARMGSPTPPPGPIDRPHHDREARRRIDGERLARRRDRDEAGAGAQCGTRGKPRRTGVASAARNHDRVAARIFVTLDARDRKARLPQRRSIEKRLRANVLENRHRNADGADV